MIPVEHRRRYRLSRAVTIEFVYRPSEVRKGEVSMIGLACEWDPTPPRFRPGNARNKFLRRYQAARNDFMQELAQLIGGNVLSMLSIDLDQHMRLGEVTAFTPVVPS
jgi:hypothetical protein